MKKFTSIFFILILTAIFSTTAYANSNTIKILINNNELSLQDDIKAFIKYDRTFIPLRLISENLGYNVTWSKDTWLLPKGEKKITICKDDNLLELWIDKNIGILNSKKIKIDDNVRIKPLIKNSRTYIPMRFLFETLGEDVDYKRIGQVNYILVNNKTNSNFKVQRHNGKNGEYFDVYWDNPLDWKNINIDSKYISEFSNYNTIYGYGIFPYNKNEIVEYKANIMWNRDYFETDKNSNLSVIYLYLNKENFRDKEKNPLIHPKEGDLLKIETKIKNLDTNEVLIYELGIPIKLETKIDTPLYVIQKYNTSTIPDQSNMQPIKN